MVASAPSHVRQYPTIIVDPCVLSISNHDCALMVRWGRLRGSLLHGATISERLCAERLEDWATRSIARQRI